jgi:hypothetical protein
MAIKNLTQVPHAFLKLGQVRKGERYEEAGKIRMRDLDYFRVTFRPDEHQAEQVFRQVYGPEPRAINIRLAFPEISQVWDAFYECYSKGGMIAKAGTDSDGTLRWLFYRDHSTGEVLIRDGLAVNQGGRELLASPIDVTKAIYTYKTKDGQAAAYLEPVGRLNVVIPELAKTSSSPGAPDFYPGRVGYLEFRPTSPHDIRNISAELAAIDYIARQAGKNLTGIPMVLKRREDEISKNINGKLSHGPSWLVHIEVSPTWGDAAFVALEQSSYPEIKILPPPAVDDIEETWDDDLPAAEPPAAAAPVFEDSTEKSVIEPVPADRPYPPEQLKAHLQELAEKYTEKSPKLPENIKQVVAINLGECFAPAEDSEYRRRVLTWWIYGKEHLADLLPGQLLTLRSWLNPSQDPGGAFHVDGMAAREAQAAYTEAEKAKGQTEMPL